MAPPTFFAIEFNVNSGSPSNPYDVVVGGFGAGIDGKLLVAHIDTSATIVTPPPGWTPAGPLTYKKLGDSSVDTSASLWNFEHPTLFNVSAVWIVAIAGATGVEHVVIHDETPGTNPLTAIAVPWWSAIPGVPFDEQLHFLAAVYQHQSAPANSAFVTPPVVSGSDLTYVTQRLNNPGDLSIAIWEYAADPAVAPFDVTVTGTHPDGAAGFTTRMMLWRFWRPAAGGWMIGRVGMS